MNDLQQDELLALTSIYPNSITTVPSPSYLSLSIKLESLDLGQARSFIVKDAAAVEEPVVVPPSILEASTSTLAPTTPEGPTKRSRNRRKHEKVPPSSPPPPSAPISVLPSPPKAQESLVITLGSLKTSATTAPNVVLLRPPPAPTILPTVEIRDEAEDGLKKLDLRYLPSIELEVELSSEYPESAAPTVRVKEDAGWLSHKEKAKLEERLAGVWKGEECLWELVDTISTPETLFSILEWDAFPRTLEQKTISSTPLSTSLNTHNRLWSSTAFSAANFSCGICLERKKGKTCVKLNHCDDVFCLPCLVSYFTLLITEGLVSSVHCPAVECVKARSHQSKQLGARKALGERRIGDVTRAELLNIVGEELVKRWEWLCEKQLLESDAGTCICPRTGCQSLVPKPSEDGELRVCPHCTYAFCVFCRQTWHGTQSSCSLPQSTSLVAAYLEGDDSVKESLEKRYGKNNMRRLVKVSEEERLNREWVEANSMPCPGCKVSVERSAGCAHMQCARCSTHFCFRCGVKLSALDPYAHFSVRGTSCFNRLFDFRPGNEPPPAEWLHLIDDH